MKLTRLIPSIILALCIFPAFVRADEPATQPDSLVGPKFVSHTWGISFDPPANSVELQKAVQDLIVEFDREVAPQMVFKAQRFQLTQPLPLSIHKNQFGAPVDGMLEQMVTKLKQQYPGIQVLRNEVINVGRLNVGILAMRNPTVDPAQRSFTIQAYIEAPETNSRLYYVLQLIAPGKPTAEPDDVENPSERLAVQTFEKAVDSVVLLDRTDIVQDQRDRLFRTRSFFAGLNDNDGLALRRVLVPEQWQRIVRDGKDIGYQYIVEEVQENTAKPSKSIARIGVRCRTLATPKLQLDTQTWFTVSLDRAHESWWTSVRAIDPTVPGRVLDAYSQVGISDEETRAVQAHPEDQPSPSGALGGPPGEDNGPLGQGNVDIRTVRNLQIITTHRDSTLAPLNQLMPAEYIPQAVGFLLPNLLPLDRPRTYMFAEFVPGNPNDQNPASSIGCVMRRYVDVMPVANITFNGEDHQAIAINDKVTIEGTPTTYYFKPDGKFLGNMAAYTDPQTKKTTTIMVLPTDSDTLQRLWSRPDLSRPQEAPAPPEEH